MLKYFVFLITRADLYPLEKILLEFLSELGECAGWVWLLGH